MTDWNIDDRIYSLTVTIPANCRSRVLFDRIDAETLTESGKRVREMPELRLAEVTDGWKVYVSSGTYHFRARRLP